MFQIFIVKKLRSLKHKSLVLHYTSKHIFIGQRSKMQTTITNKIHTQFLKRFKKFFIHFGNFAKNIYLMVKGFYLFQNVCHLFCLKSL